MHYVAISELSETAVRHLIPVAKTIPHGLDTNEYPFNERPDSAQTTSSTSAGSLGSRDRTAQSMLRRSPARSSFSPVASRKRRRTRRTSNAWGRPSTSSSTWADILSTGATTKT